jgi:hypothetical protein
MFTWPLDYFMSSSSSSVERVDSTSDSLFEESIEPIAETLSNFKKPIQCDTINYIF